MRYHGNWCGPNWSDGAHVGSRRGFAPAVDEFDETCREHDFSYADGGDLRAADLRFARANVGRGVKRTAAAIAVGLQGLSRPSKNNYFSVAGRKRHRSGSVVSHTPPRTPARNLLVGTSGRVSFTTIGTLTEPEPVMSSVNPTAVIDGHHGGRYFNKTPLSDRMDHAMLRTNGVKSQFEHRFTRSTAEIQWFGHHNMPYTTVLRVMVHSALRHLLKFAGFDIDDFTRVVEPAVSGCVVRFVYHSGPESLVVLSVDSGVGPTATYLEWSAAILSIVTTAAFGFTDIVPLWFYLVKPVRDSAGTASTEIFLAQLRLDQSEFVVKGSTRLSVQNQSLAQAGGEENDLSDNVAATPLEGRYYHLTNTNYAQKKGRNSLPSDLVCDPLSGTTSLQALIDGAQPFSEPPDQYNFYGVKFSSAISLVPGAVKTNQFTSVKVFKWKNYLRNYGQKSIIVGNSIHFGHMGLFAFEKIIGTATAGPLISLGYNLDLMITVCIVAHSYSTPQPIVEHLALT